jgi:hypothetical protein
MTLSFTLNDATNVIFDSDGNVGIYQDGDSVYESYVEWANNGGVLRHVHITSDKSDCHISKLEFMNRFLPDELAAIYTTANSNVYVQIWLDKFKVSEFVDISDTQTIEGVYALEQLSLIAQGRASIILAE